MSAIDSLSSHSRLATRRLTTRWLRIAAAPLAALMLQLLGAPPAAADARTEGDDGITLTLTRDSLGQTREQILEAHGLPIPSEAAAPEQVDEGTAPGPSATEGADAAEAAESSEVWRDEEEAPAETTSTGAPATALAADATRCIEISIRAGNGLDESSRVCRAIFPE